MIYSPLTKKKRVWLFWIFWILPKGVNQIQNAAARWEEALYFWLDLANGLTYALDPSPNVQLSHSDDLILSRPLSYTTRPCSIWDSHSFSFFLFSFDKKINQIGIVNSPTMRGQEPSGLGGDRSWVQMQIHIPSGSLRHPASIPHRAEAQSRAPVFVIMDNDDCWL